MNVYDKFLEEVGKIDHSKEEIIPRQYYDFLCDKTKEYYKLIEQQKPIIQHDDPDFEADSVKCCEANCPFNKVNSPHKYVK